MNARVRPAVPEDIPWLIDQLRVFSVQYSTKTEFFPGNDFAAQWLTNMMTSHLLLVADSYKTSERLGFIAGVVTPHYYNPKVRALAELFWWVVPEHRAGPAGVRLLDEFVAWGKKNADWISFGIMTDTPVKDAALIKRGFAFKEKAYVMEVG